jgi:predicted RND superfamily exporter protein
MKSLDPVDGPLPSADDFSRDSGSFLERLLFNNRLLVLVLCVIVTAVLGFTARKVELNASFEAVIPTKHPFIQNYLRHQGELRGLGNTLRIVVETTGDSILDPAYLKTLQQINDEVLLIPGVERSYMASLWTRGVRWISVTEAGLDGGPVMPDSYDGSPASLQELRGNILRSGQVGSLVANDFKSSSIIVPLLDYDAQAQQPLDYSALSKRIEEIRAKYESRDGNSGVRIRVVGFAKVMGDLIDGLGGILTFFLIAVAIATAMVYWFNRCVRSTVLVVVCSIVAVVWQLGLLPLLGFRLDPYSILVPFLVFAIGMSHGAQKMNGVMQDIGRGLPRLAAARNTFRRLFFAGFTALVCDAVGFAVLWVVEIKAIHDLALIASLGVAILIFTNLILLPILLTYTGVSPRAAKRALDQETVALTSDRKAGLWRFLDLFTQRRWATVALVVAVVMGVIGLRISSQLQIGDLQAGAPELRQTSRYNVDNAYVASHYSTSSDVMAVMVETPRDQCADYETLMKLSDLQSRLRSVPGVEASNSLADLARQMGSAYNEGSFKWAEIVPNQSALNSILTQAPRGLFNDDCNLLTLYVYLADHKAATLERTVAVVQDFAKAHDNAQVRFLLAAGNAGIESATNQVVKQTSNVMLYGVYAAVILLTLLAFRSWRAVVVAVVPLVLTSILAEALMVALGIGVKVATLPVVALGVGIGVDYALYILSVTLQLLRQGKSLSEAYYHSLLFTGRVVMLTGFTLAAGVATWILSPIKFQADMGLLLAFMFLWNMLGALILVPALAVFLLPQRRAAAASSGSAAASSSSGAAATAAMPATPRAHRG